MIFVGIHWHGAEWTGLPPGRRNDRALIRKSLGLRPCDPDAGLVACALVQVEFCLEGRAFLLGRGRPGYQENQVFLWVVADSQLRYGPVQIVWGFGLSYFFEDSLEVGATRPVEFAGDPGEELVQTGGKGLDLEFFALESKFSTRTRGSEEKDPPSRFSDCADLDALCGF